MLSALTYKQLIQLRNAVRQTLVSPKRLVAVLVGLTYLGVSISFIVVLLTLPPLPADILTMLAELGITLNARTQLEGFRGALSITLLMIGSTALFQNPLLRFSAPDRDVLFTTPISLQAVMLGRIGNNLIRTLLVGYFFWGLGLVPLLRLLDYPPLPLGIWGVLAVMLLFSTVDQSTALLQMLVNRPDNPHSSTAQRWLLRLVLVLFALVGAVLVVGVCERVLTGEWALLGGLLQTLGGPVGRVLLFPATLTADLLLLPVEATVNPPLAAGVLLLLHLLTGWLLLRQTHRAGGSTLMEAALAPLGQPNALDRLFESVGHNPVRFVGALWAGNLAVDSDGARHARSRTPFGVGATAHIWRRLLEVQRTPFRNLLAVLALGALPLLLYNPSEPFSTGRLVAAIIFSASLGTQLFSDALDHLLYANLELATPVPRWRLLLAAHVPRLLVCWLGGLLLVLAAGTLSVGTDWLDVGALILWYPVMLVPLLALRTTIVFLFPSAAIPGQRDPVQALVVTILNGLLILVAIGVALLPFSALSLLAEVTNLGRGWFWLFVFAASAGVAVVALGIVIWSYYRYEPRESH